MAPQPVPPLPDLGDLMRPYLTERDFISLMVVSSSFRGLCRDPFWMLKFGKLHSAWYPTQQLVEGWEKPVVQKEMKRWARKLTFNTGQESSTVLESLFLKAFPEFSALQQLALDWQALGIVLQHGSPMPNVLALTIDPVAAEDPTTRTVRSRTFSVQVEKPIFPNLIVLSFGTLLDVPHEESSLGEPSRSWDLLGTPWDQILSWMTADNLSQLDFWGYDDLGAYIQPTSHLEARLSALPSLSTLSFENFGTFHSDPFVRSPVWGRLLYLDLSNSFTLSQVHQLLALTPRLDVLRLDSQTNRLSSPLPDPLDPFPHLTTLVLSRTETPHSDTRGFIDLLHSTISHPFSRLTRLALIEVDKTYADRQIAAALADCHSLEELFLEAVPVAFMWELLDKVPLSTTPLGTSLKHFRFGFGGSASPFTVDMVNLLADIDAWMAALVLVNYAQLPPNRRMGATPDRWRVWTSIRDGAQHLLMKPQPFSDLVS